MPRHYRNNNVVVVVVVMVVCDRFENYCFCSCACAWVRCDVNKYDNYDSNSYYDSCIYFVSSMPHQLLLYSRRFHPSLSLIVRFLRPPRPRRPRRICQGSSNRTGTCY